MSTAVPDDRLLDAVRASSPETRARVLRELLAEYAHRGGRWPMPVPDRDEILGYLFPRPGGSGNAPPVLSPEREAELNERLNHLDEGRDLRDYIAKLDSPGGSA